MSIKKIGAKMGIFCACTKITHVCMPCCKMAKEGRHLDEEREQEDSC